MSRQNAATGPLLGLAFTSIRARSLTAAERDALVSDSRQYNARTGISSVLLHCDGAFMQYMEGPEHNLRSTFDAIRRDPRHYGLIELFCEAIPAREFADWPMLYQDADDGAVDPFEVADWLQPEPGSVAPGRLLLSHFWKNNHSLRTRQ